MVQEIVYLLIFKIIMANNKNSATPTEKETTEDTTPVVETTNAEKTMVNEEQALAKTVKSIFDATQGLDTLIVCADGEAFSPNNKPQAERWAKVKKLKLYEISSKLEVTFLTDYNEE